MKPTTRELANANRAVADLLAEILEPCGHCGSRPLGHQYVLLATLAVTNEKDSALLKFFEAVKDHQWARLRESQSWRGAADDVEAYAIRCQGSKLSLAVIKTHFELLQPARLLYSEALSLEDGNRLLEAFANLHWHTM